MIATESLTTVPPSSITGTKPWPLMPSVKTFKESNIAIDGQGWFGLYAPANTPADMIERLNKATASTFSNDEIKGRIEKLGLVAQTSTPSELAVFQRKDSGVWQAAVKASGFTPQQ